MDARLDRDPPRRTRIVLAHDATRFIEVDAVVSKTHTISADVTDSPIERGADTTDHYRRKHREFTVTGIFSDYPIRTQDQAVSQLERNRSTLANEFLDNAITQGFLINIETRLYNYQNYAILNKQVTEDKDSTRSVNFTLSVREIIIARTEQTDAPVPIAAAPENPNRNRKRNRGRQNKREEMSERNQEDAANVASGTVDNRSLLAQGLDRFRGN